MANNATVARCWKASALLFVSFLSSAFGGLQAIMILAWLQPLFLLLFLHHSEVFHQPLLPKIGILLLTCVVQAVGYAVAFAGMLNISSSFLAANLGFVFLMCILFWIVLLLPFLTHLQFRIRFPHAVFSRPFVFASIWTALWHVSACINPIGSTGNPAYTQYSFQSIVLTARLWGLEGIVFLLAWTAAVAHESLLLRHHTMFEGSLIDSPPFPDQNHCSNFDEDSGSAGSTDIHFSGRGWRTYASRYTKIGTNLCICERQCCQLRDHAFHVKLWGTVVLLSLVFGGAQEILYSGSFFQKRIEKTIKPTVQASCVLGNRLSGNDALWNNTVQRIAAGDALILWPEAAGGTVVGDDEEAKLFSEAARVVSLGLHMRNSLSDQTQRQGPYLGITYIKQMNTGKQFLAEVYNCFALILPNGKVGFTYSKTHPVYVAGENISAGPGTLKFVDTSIGRISAAICFDFEFPTLIRQAGNMGNSVVQYSRTHASATLCTFICFCNIEHNSNNLHLTTTIISPALRSLIRRVDIMLDTAETWGSIGHLEFMSDSFRAVENGFMMLRCSLNGVSGVVTPFNDVLNYREALDDSILIMDLPISKRAKTLYPQFGFLFGWMIDFIALFYVAVSWGPFCLIQKVAKCFLKSHSCNFIDQHGDRGHGYQTYGNMEFFRGDAA